MVYPSCSYCGEMMVKDHGSEEECRERQVKELEELDLDALIERVALGSQLAKTRLRDYIRSLEKKVSHSSRMKS